MAMVEGKTYPTMREEEIKEGWGDQSLKGYNRR